MTTPRELLEDLSMTPDTPIKVLKEVQEVVVTTPQELLEDQSITLDTPIRVFMKEAELVMTTPRELLEDQSMTPDTPIRVLREEQEVVVITPQELLEDQSIMLDTPIQVLKEERKVVVTTPEELLRGQRITLDTPIKILLKEEEMVVASLDQLLSDKSISLETPIKIVIEGPEEKIAVSKLFEEGKDLSDLTLYVHTVTRGDTQGIWGIIQHGLMDQFRRGIPVHGDQKPPPILTLDIPTDADEPREDGYSSFLGRVLDQKTRDSYVYNYRTGRMGRNPDRISPGQELIITEFSQDELVEIYKHFKQMQ